MTAIDAVGGEDGVRRLVKAFYDLVEQTPEGANLRRLHMRGQGIAQARIEQVDFLCGFLGGRAHYRERHGHMDVKLIHAHVPITIEDAETWLALMDRALATCGHAGPEIERIRVSFRRVAHILVNDLAAWGDGVLSGRDQQ